MSAITGGTPDSDTLNANIVVSLEAPGASVSACTGVLLTPTVVVTARACLGSKNATNNPVVRVGAHRSTAAAYKTTGAAVIIGAADPDAPDLASPHGEIALVFLDPTTPVLDGAAIRHQSLEAPNGAPTTNPLVLAYGGMAAAGWSADGGSSQQRIAFAFPLLSLSTYWSGALSDQAYWLRNTLGASGRLETGDLGGPLLSGAGDLVGIAVARDATPTTVPGCPAHATCDVWDDVTSDPSRQWIVETLRIPRDQLRPTWRKMHTRGDVVRPDGMPDWWRGEVDYTGPCDTANDADCDRWYDRNADGTRRDNCPGKKNPDQLDSDDDGVGDACDSCQNPQLACTRGGGTVQCGATVVACGKPVDCGPCGSGLSCISNVCRSCATCADLGATCGTVTNNCGQTLNCGGCAQSSACINNSCVVCTPLPACPRDAQCGGFSNNCGQSVSCGDCFDDGYECDAQLHCVPPSCGPNQHWCPQVGGGFCQPNSQRCHPT